MARPSSPIEILLSNKRAKKIFDRVRANCLVAMFLRWKLERELRKLDGVEDGLLQCGPENSNVWNGWRYEEDHDGVLVRRRNDSVQVVAPIGSYCISVRQDIVMFICVA